jgi:hypothetical protein
MSLPLDLSVTIRHASNGFIIHYEEVVNGLDVSAEFVALDLEEALGIIYDCFDTPDSHDMSNILDETIPQG